MEICVPLAILFLESVELQKYLLENTNCPHPEVLIQQIIMKKPKIFS